MLQYTLAANETERECLSVLEPLSTLRMGLLLYAQGVTDRWQRREGYKCKKRGGWYSYLYSASYLTLTAGDKGIKCPSELPNSAKKDRQGRHHLPRWRSCQHRMPLRTAGCTAFRHARLERPPGRHVGGCAGAWAQSDRLPRQVPCRGRRLVTPGSLSLTGPCRDAWRVAASSLRCLGWPSRQAPLAGALSP